MEETRVLKTGLQNSDVYSDHPKEKFLIQMEKTQASSREQLVLSFRNNEWSGISLVVQWLGPCAFTDEGRGSVSGQATEIHKPHSTAPPPPPPPKSTDLPETMSVPCGLILQWFKRIKMQVFTWNVCYSMLPVNLTSKSSHNPIRRQQWTTSVCGPSTAARDTASC